MTDEIMKALEAGVAEAARLLVKRVKEGTASAADITQLRAMHKEAGGTLTFRGSPTPAGDTVLDSMRDVDPNLLN